MKINLIVILLAVAVSGGCAHDYHVSVSGDDQKGRLTPVREPAQGGSYILLAAIRCGTGWCTLFARYLFQKVEVGLVGIVDTF